MIIGAVSYVSRSDEQKLSIVDLFRSVYATNFPNALTRCVLVMEWEAQPQEADSEQHIDVFLTHPDGTQVFLAANTQYSVPAEPAMMGVPNFLNTIVDLAGLTFYSPGLHTICILANGEKKGSASLYVYGTQE